MQSLAHSEHLRCANCSHHSQEPQCAHLNPAPVSGAVVSSEEAPSREQADEHPPSDIFQALPELDSGPSFVGQGQAGFVSS